MKLGNAFDVGPVNDGLVPGSLQVAIAFPVEGRVYHDAFGHSVNAIGRPERSGPDLPDRRSYPRGRYRS